MLLIVTKLSIAALGQVMSVAPIFGEMTWPQPGTGPTAGRPAALPVAKTTSRPGPRARGEPRGGRRARDPCAPAG